MHFAARHGVKTACSRRTLSGRPLSHSIQRPRSTHCRPWRYSEAAIRELRRKAKTGRSAIDTGRSAGLAPYKIVISDLSKKLRPRRRDETDSFHRVMRLASANTSSAGKVCSSLRS